MAGLSLSSCGICSRIHMVLLASSSSHTRPSICTEWHTAHHTLSGKMYAAVSIFLLPIILSAFNTRHPAVLSQSQLPAPAAATSNKVPHPRAVPPIRCNCTEKQCAIVKMTRGNSHQLSCSRSGRSYHQTSTTERTICLGIAGSSPATCKQPPATNHHNEGLAAQNGQPPARNKQQPPMRGGRSVPIPPSPGGPPARW
jgi:hypothetical protein